MKVLIVKTSSMGDVIHTLPALTDAARIYPDITFDWVVEESFAEIPAWHSHVRRVIPTAWRRWRKSIFAKNTRQELKSFWSGLRAESYDLVIDAQGLVKSAMFTLMSKGKRSGLDLNSARERLASFAYQQKCTVNFHQHAIVRMREIFSKLLNYPLPITVPEYGIAREKFYDPSRQENYVVFLHGTTWDTKLWPEQYWIELGKKAAAEGFSVKLLWGNKIEEERAHRLATQVSNMIVLPRQDLGGSAKVLANARGVVAVDTGLAHMATALNVPTIALYGPTNPAYSGIQGRSQLSLAVNYPCAPCLKRECTFLGTRSSQAVCFKTLPPEKVWQTFSELLESVTPS